MEARTDPNPAMPMPSGTVTFLFSDVEGSTLRWEHDRADMEVAVRRHDTLVRTAIVGRHGYVFKTVGDAFCAVFGRPDEAVAAALDAQRTLLAEDFSAVDGLPVRMALHTGTAEERDGDYFGPTVNRVSRLLAIGNGGQILVSGVTTDLVQGTLPSQASLQDLGAHRLRDLTYPEQVYQLIAPGLRSDFPALRSLEVLPNNLPLQLTSFVGRDREVGEIESLLKKHRVVTVVGSGGVGKTRASLQVGANMLDGSGDGAWFVELAPLADGSVIPSAIASAIGVELPAGVPLDALVAKLKAKQLLLILDNCEHLVESTARVVDALVRGCPNVVVLASSRQGLGIAGEATYRMPSLSVPDAAGAVGLATADLRRYGAIALFVERAEAADQQFALTDENAPAVADICRRLDGIAFAIELAAARVRMLSPQQLQRRLDERFRILTGGSRTALPRQQTLRALIDWSYELLDARERALFRRVGVFVDGFSLEGASAVCTDATFDELELFDVLASLVDKSLVVAELSGPATRYRLLESTRAYALEKLSEADESKRLFERHLAYIHELTMRAAESFQAMTSAEPFAFIDTELENVRAAVTYALNGGNATIGAEIALAIFDDVLQSTELAQWYERFLEVVEAEDLRLRAQLAMRLATTLAATGRSERAREVSQGGMLTARSTNDPVVIFEALLRQMSLLRRSTSLDAAASAIAEAEALLEKVETPRRRLQFLQARGLLAGMSGDLAGAARDFTEMQRLCRLYANENAARNIVINFAEFEHQHGNTARAIEMIADALPAQRRKHSPEALSNVLVNASAYCLAEDRFSEAFAFTVEALRLGKESSAERLFVTIAIQQTAALLALEGRLAPAARLEGYAAANYAAMGFEPEYTERVTQQRLHELLANLPESERTRFAAEGATLSLEAALDEALDALREPSQARPNLRMLG
jgi:predicted ATPase/class 3 adenylate cyclase